MDVLVGILSPENLTRFISFQGSYVQHKVKVDVIREVDSDSKKSLSTESEDFESLYLNKHTPWGNKYA